MRKLIRGSIAWATSAGTTSWFQVQARRDLPGNALAESVLSRTPRHSRRLPLPAALASEMRSSSNATCSSLP
jgi:hypothetical protein